MGLPSLSTYPIDTNTALFIAEKKSQPAAGGGGKGKAKEPKKTVDEDPDGEKLAKVCHAADVRVLQFTVFVFGPGRESSGRSPKIFANSRNVLCGQNRDKFGRLRSVPQIRWSCIRLRRIC